MLTQFPHFQNLALALLFAVAYHLAFWIQFHLLGAFDFAKGVSLFFVPAGIKILAIVIGGAWGISGVLLTSLLLSPMVWGEMEFVHALGGQLVWAGTPYLTYLLLKRILHIDDLLLSLKGKHIVIIAVATTFASNLADRSYRLPWATSTATSSMPRCGA